MIFHPGRKCACGCGRSAEGASKYYSEKCQQKVARDKARENYVPRTKCAFPGCNKSRWANREFCPEHSPTHRKKTPTPTLHSGYSTCEGPKNILVFDPLVSGDIDGDCSYRISESEYKLYAADYQKLGIRVEKKGQLMLL